MNRQQIIRVGAIVAVAGITGFVMQTRSPDPVPARAAAPAPVAEDTATAPIAPESVVQLSAGDTAPGGPPGLSLAATTPAIPGLSLSAPAAPVEEAQAEAAPETTDAPAPLAEAAPTCSEDMALIAQPGAMLDLGLLAPCRPDQRVLIRHGGLVVTARTSVDGTLVASIPALQHPAEVALAFADGTQVSESVAVADLDRFDRFAVQWMAEDAFQLHALERGAAHGDAGHVSAAAPRRATPEGHFLSILGDDSTERPLMAEVYTWPVGVAALSGQVGLSLEAAVTETTCGREILGETLQLTAGALTLRELSIEMPDCAAVGEFVVLPNPVAAEKLASR